MSTSRTYHHRVTEPRPDEATRQLASLVDELVQTVGAGAGEVAVVPVSDGLWAVNVDPYRATAAPIGLLVMNDEVSGSIGRVTFYADWGDAASNSRLRDILTMTMLGRVEERVGIGEPVLRVHRFTGRPYVIGAVSVIPWWLRRPRTWDPYDASVLDRGESLRTCPDCGHIWSEHPGSAEVPDLAGACGECEYEVEHGQAPNRRQPCRRAVPGPA